MRSALVEVLEAVNAQIEDADAGGEAVADEVAGRLRQHDLSAVSGGSDSRRAMHVHAHVARGPQAWLAGVESHAYPDGVPVRPVMRFERSLRLRGRGDRVTGPREDGEEGVALGADLVAVARRESRSQDRALVGQKRGVLVAESMQVRGRAFDVGKEERDRPFGERRRHGPIMCQAAPARGSASPSPWPLTCRCDASPAHPPCYPSAEGGQTLLRRSRRGVASRNPFPLR